MCLLSIAYHTLPGCPVFVLANREESPNRPSAAPAVVDAPRPGGRWLGGRDLQAGGTWLGVNRTGLMVAVTNRPKIRTPADPKSRGLLCRELLEAGSFDAAEAEFHRQWNTEEFAGFNLMLISAERGWIFSAGDDLRIQPLSPGIHAVTNRDWNDPGDKRISRVRGLMESFPRENLGLEEWIQQSKTIGGLGEDAGDDAVCIPCTKGWGTVSSSIIALRDDVAQSRYLHAAGSPASTAYHDYSPLLISLLENAP
jgi:uncharacterized protein with NRDE domain